METIVLDYWIDLSFEVPADTAAITFDGDGTVWAHPEAPYFDPDYDDWNSDCPELVGNVGDLRPDWWDTHYLWITCG